MSEPEYKPSLLCRLIGHKWFLKDNRQRPKVRSNDPNELPVIDTIYSPMSHCMRCGVPNNSHPK